MERTKNENALTTMKFTTMKTSGRTGGRTKGHNKQKRRWRVLDWRKSDALNLPPKIKYLNTIDSERGGIGRMSRYVFLYATR